VFAVAGSIYDGYAKAAEDRQATTEITQGASVLSSTQMELNGDYNKMITSGDPNEAQANASNWMQNVFDPKAEELIGAAKTDKARKYLTERVQSWREHMYAKIEGDVNTRVVSARTQNLENTITSSGNMVMNDWTTRDIALGNVESAWAAMKSDGTMTPDQIAKGDEAVRTARKGIIKNGVDGLILANPAAAKAQLMDGQGPFAELDADVRQNLIRDAEVMEGRQRTSVNYQRTELDRQQKELSEKTSNDLLKSFYTPDGKFVVPPGADQVIITDPRIRDEDKGKLLTMIDKIQTFGDGQGKNEVFNQFYAASLQGKFPTTMQRVEAVNKGDLTPQQSEYLGKMSESPDSKLNYSEQQVVKDAYGYAQKVLDPKSQFGASLDTSGSGARRVYEFSVWMNKMIDSGARQGLNAEAVLSDPRNQKTMQQMIQALKMKKYPDSDWRPPTAAQTGGTPAAPEAPKKSLEAIWGAP